ncbi:SpoIIE family protein phosphatase [Streptomyces bobili]|uniref:SpoIIE family protein phosphatase n=1 Tax=Streptomyces bobili TaxID=67280 RepID=UPI00365F6E88
MDTSSGHYRHGTGDVGEALVDVAAALIDDSGVVRQWSSGAAELLGRSAKEVCGRPASQLFADPAELDAVRWSGPVAPEEKVFLSHARGHTVAVHCRVLPLESSGTPTHHLLLVVPADRAEESEQGAALLRALLAQESVGFVMRDSALSVVRTNLDSAHSPLLSLGGTPADRLEEPDAAAAEAGLREVLATGVPLVDPAKPVRTVSGSLESSVSVIAVRTTDRRGRPSGVTVLSTDATEQWEATRRLHLRHQAAFRIGLSLDVRHTAQDIADVLVPDFADLVGVDLAERVLEGDEPPKAFFGGDPHLRRVAVGAVGDWPAGLLRPGDAIPSLPDEPKFRALQDGHAIVADRAEAMRMMALGGDSLSRMLFPGDAHFLALAPLFARGLVLGAIGVWRRDREKPFEQHDVDLLTEIAAHAALSIDNGRRYTREHRAAVTLQQRLLPAATTHTPAVDTVGRYLPAAGGAEIGGDWFDAVPLPSLRVAMVVGDVIGHGLHAAATMGRLRTAVQTLADLELPPDELLTRLDELVARLAAEANRGERDTVGATCLVALYDPVTQRCSFASAGHPPPLVVAPDGHARRVPVRPGPPLGVGGLPFETTDLHLAPGNWLALYTDGLLGRPADDIDAAVDRLGEQISRLRRSDCSLEAVSHALTGERSRTPAADDTALLLARIRPLHPDAIAEWEFAADPAAVAGARAAAAGKLADWGLTDLEFTVELIVSELVTNAVRYAGGPIDLRLIRDGVLFCEVSDPSNTQPRLRRASTADEGGRGLFLVAQLSNRWGSRYGQSGKTIWAELMLPG